MFFSNALTWRDVQHLIAETSVSAGLTADFYSNGVGKKGTVVICESGSSISPYSISILL